MAYCLIFHTWVYLPNSHGGRPMRRKCKRCGQMQVWNYDIARERGIIVWEDA